MIIIKIDEGLGNQLFKYAFARSLSYDLDTELYIDKYDSKSFKSKLNKKIFKIAEKPYNFLCNHFKEINRNFFYDFSYYLEDIHHSQYFLNQFNIKENLINKKEIKNLNYYNLPYVEYEKLLEFKEIPKIKTPAYITGAFQSEKYFSHNEDIIREDLKFKNSIEGKNKEISEDIQNNNSIAIHIRRGDYLRIPSMGLCTLNYYSKAIKFISKQINNPKFYIFSNDPVWVKKNIKIQYPTYYVDNNSDIKGYEDLRLMSLCDNFIIANSSFSWWGAWLSENKNKIIIRPQPWFFSNGTDFYDINSKLCKRIPNNYSSYFDNSTNILLNLNSNNFGKDNVNYENIKIDLDIDTININSTNKRPKLFFKNMVKKNEENPVIFKLSCHSDSVDALRLFFITKENKNYHHGHSFGVAYSKNEELNIYFPLPNNALINDLMFVPAKKKNSTLHIKSIEIREIRKIKELI